MGGSHPAPSRTKSQLAAGRKRTTQCCARTRQLRLSRLPSGVGGQPARRWAVDPLLPGAQAPALREDLSTTGTSAYRKFERLHRPTAHGLGFNWSMQHTKICVSSRGVCKWDIGRSCLDAACFRIEARRTHRPGHRAGIAPGARSPHHGHTAHGHRRLGQFARRASPWVSSGSRRSPPSFAGG